MGPQSRADLELQKFIYQHRQVLIQKVAHKIQSGQLPINSLPTFNGSMARSHVAPPAKDAEDKEIEEYLVARYGFQEGRLDNSHIFNRYRRDLLFYWATTEKPMSRFVPQGPNPICLFAAAASIINHHRGNSTWDANGILDTLSNLPAASGSYYLTSPQNILVPVNNLAGRYQYSESARPLAALTKWGSLVKAEPKFLYDWKAIVSAAQQGPIVVFINFNHDEPGLHPDGQWQTRDPKEDNPAAHAIVLLRLFSFRGQQFGTVYDSATHSVRSHPLEIIQNNVSNFKPEKTHYWGRHARGVQLL